MARIPIRTTLAGAGALALTLALPATSADAAPPGGKGPRPPDATTSAGPPADLDAIFVGAHPDDEAGTLSTFGRWGTEHAVRTGVITITRGEGGGNAVGPEEGPALGLIREREERAAVAKAGITDVYNLDEVDFYYTVSEPLTAQVWDHDEALGKVVRVLRQTRPEVVVTMNPAPSPGNHGNHQEAARLAIEAYEAAGDPSRFPEQITREGLRPFAPDRVLMRTANGTTANGPQCAQRFVPADPSQTVYGVWSGAAVTRRADLGRRRAGRPARVRLAGLGRLPRRLDRPERAGLRLPHPGRVAHPGARVGHRRRDDRARRHRRLARCALPGGLPLGSRMTVEADRFRVLPGEPFEVTVGAGAPARLGARKRHGHGSRCRPGGR